MSRTAPAAVVAPALRVAAASRSATQLTITLSAPPLDGARDPQVYVDQDVNPGGRFAPWDGAWARAGAKLTFSPRFPLPAEREVRVSLPTLRGSSGALEAHGLAPVSFPARDADAIGELRFPARAASTAAGSAGADDHGNDLASATPLPVNSALAGEVEVAGDRDWFRVDLRAGTRYQLAVETSGDSTLGVFDAGGARVAFNDDDPAGGLDSRLEFTPTRSGTHGLEVRAYGSGTLSYSVRVTPAKAATAAGAGTPASDDHGDDLASATPWTGAAVRGEIGAPGDVDVFVIQLSGGASYTLRTETTGDTTLTVRDASGAQLAFNDDAPGGGRESELSLRAPRDGAYSVEVAGYGGQQPSYTLRSHAEQALTPERFSERAGTDVWHIDFELRRDLFDADLERHGLRSGDGETDRLMRRRVIALVLSELGQKYGLDEHGDPVAGRSLRISFSSATPSGRVRRDHSREAVGGRHTDTTSTLGVSYLDPGNRRAEDNSALGELGIFTQVIYGSSSRLSPRLSSGDRPYLDGSYALGDGSSSEDRRFRLVRDVSADWAHAIAVVTAHEVGHSVGLDHDESDRRGIMQSALSRYVLSDRRTAFGQATSRTLERNLGID
ncbi:MAG: pre-peptidase C-terminal domain-containing protein [Planctomycetes bacterium]|nr:pre-peptidase C-terminal domain-containing protein [Planctomycetota bacterium]